MTRRYCRGSTTPSRLVACAADVGKEERVVELSIAEIEIRFARENVEPGRCHLA